MAEPSNSDKGVVFIIIALCALAGCFLGHWAGSV